MCRVTPWHNRAKAKSGSRHSDSEGMGSIPAIPYA